MVLTPIIFSCWRSRRSRISLNVLLVYTACSNALLIFFIATRLSLPFPPSSSLAAHTTPYAPRPTTSISAYLWSSIDENIKSQLLRGQQGIPHLASTSKWVPSTLYRRIIRLPLRVASPSKRTSGSREDWCWSAAMPWFVCCIASPVDSLTPYCFFESWTRSSFWLQ